MPFRGEEERETEQAGGEQEQEEEQDGEASTASARLTEAVSLRFIAALDHGRRKRSQGRPVLRSFLPVRVPRSESLRSARALSLPPPPPPPE